MRLEEPSHFKSAEAKLVAALKGIPVLRAWKAVDHERGSYREFAIAIGLTTEQEPWRVAYGRGVGYQAGEVLHLIRAIQRGTGEEVLVNLVVNARTGEPSAGFHRDVRLVDVTESN